MNTTKQVRLSNCVSLDISLRVTPYRVDGEQVVIDVWDGNDWHTVFDKRVINCCTNSNVYTAVWDAFSELSEDDINRISYALCDIDECRCDDELEDVA